MMPSSGGMSAAPKNAVFPKQGFARGKKGGVIVDYASLNLRFSFDPGGYRAGVFQ